MDSFDKELSKELGLSDENGRTEYFSKFDTERKEREKNLRESIEKDPKGTIQEILIDTIVHDQDIAKRFNKVHGMTFINAVKQLAELSGVSLASEMDVEIALPEDPTKAQKKILDSRASGELKSRQATDLSALVDKMAQYEKIEDLLEFVKKVSEDSRFNVGSGIEIKKRVASND